MSYSLLLTEKAENDLKQWKKSGQIKTLRKILNLFDELEQHPQTGTGKPEALKNDLSGYWSRQIDKKNRLIYRIDEGIVVVEVISLWSHYGDK